MPVQGLSTAVPTGPQSAVHCIRSQGISPMAITLTANYKDLFVEETVAKIDELLEESYALDDILEFIDENSEVDFITYYEAYCEAGEDIGYDVVDAFVKMYDISYVEHVKEAYYGSYDSEKEFAEEYYTNLYGDGVLNLVVVDWQATWDCMLRYDFDFADGFVFNSNF